MTGSEFITLLGAAAFILSVTSWVWWQTNKLKTIVLGTAKLVEMHENPENTGFGTIGFKTVIQENTRAIRELSHYMKWMTKAQSGSDPPPFTGEGL